MKANSRKVIFAALIGNSLIAVTKFTASFISGSSAMFSEGIHSLVDTGNQILLLYGLKSAKRPASQNFPFGHGKEIYFWSFAVAIIIFAVGSGISLYEGIHHVLHPVKMDDPRINYVVLLLAMIFEGWALYTAVTEFNKSRGNHGYFTAVRREKDPTLFVVLFEDSAAMLGLAFAMAGIAMAQYTGNPVYDGIASIIIGVILGLTALWLAIETKGLLIGESASPRTVQEIRRIAARHESICSVNEVLTLHMGPSYILLNMSVEFKDSLAVGEIEKAIQQLDSEIKTFFPHIKRIFIEAEDKSPESSKDQKRL